MNFEAIQDAIRKALKAGLITEEEATQLLEDWLRDHPEPDDPDNPPIDVTEEFYKEHPIPVVIPKREEAEVSR